MTRWWQRKKQTDLEVDEFHEAGIYLPWERGECRGVRVGDLTVDAPPNGASGEQWLDWAGVTGAWWNAVYMGDKSGWWGHIVKAYNEKWEAND